ncbi:NUDIX hydrolase [Streptomyces sp. NBC_01142]|uniref:NUDIX domain-containing protein n=1 Tax=Streptomyces sp. NBC_01142 TaxID=2975865 RepID=UPI002252014B|nr:NUDIX hydrolase [Streptomyces sp. NBC_01142]MCX4826677.1 NUDIX hydrolase [Streptomyces sp. NBC_01142]
MEPTTARSNVSAGAVIVDDQDRVLIVDPVYKPYWNLPGGHVEPGEESQDACRREVREEIGLDLEPGRLLVRATIAVPGREAHEYFVYDCGVLSPEQQKSIRLQESELRDYRFSAPEDITEQEIPPAARPMWDAALTARAEGRTIEITTP